MRKTKIGVLEMVFLEKMKKKTLMLTKTHNLNNEKKRNERQSRTGNTKNK